MPEHAAAAACASKAATTSALGDTAPDATRGPIDAVRSLAAPLTVDRAARTVEVIWSTGARARNHVAGLGTITEELDMQSSAVRMEGLRSGRAPVLDTHRGGGARDVLGRVTTARIEAHRGLATLQFSTAADVEPVWQRVVDGTLRSISVGYRVHRYDRITDPASGETVHRAVDWEPFEISLVPVPVDPAAAVRGDDGQRSSAIAVEPSLSIEESPVPEPTTLTPPAGEPSTPQAPSASPPAVDPDTSVAHRAAGVQAERERHAALGPVLVAARALVPPATCDELHGRAVAEGWSAEALRGALWDAMTSAARPPSIPATVATSALAGGDPAVVLDAMAEAIATRAMPGYLPATGSPGAGRHAEFMGWRPTEMVAELMRARGDRSVPRDAATLAVRAFQTTSDFPALLSAAANKMLLAAYAPAQPTYRNIFLRRDFRDFKPHRHLRVGDFPTLVQLSENGEIQAGTMSESQELVLLQTFARRIRVTRQMLVNDDLGAFTDFAAMIGRRVADFENVTAYALVNTATGDGPTLMTGAAPVFASAAARANKAAAGTALDLANLANARAAVMRQKTLDGLPISVGGSMRLLVGPNQELAARQLTISVGATQISNANVYAGFVQPLVEPLIPSNRWYLFADPITAPVYVYGYLNGAEGPQVTTGNVQGVDGVEVSVIFDFGVGAIDWRGGYYNAGV
jgi:hypothetical protein